MNNVRGNGYEMLVLYSSAKERQNSLCGLLCQFHLSLVANLNANRKGVN